VRRLGEGQVGSSANPKLTLTFHLSRPVYGPPFLNSNHPAICP
jgi:hypothetical protein